MESKQAVTSVIEFSKEMITKVLNIFILQIVATFTIITCIPTTADSLTSLMSICIPIYIAGLAGYSIKAGVENVAKINKTKENG